MKTQTQHNIGRIQLSLAVVAILLSANVVYANGLFENAGPVKVTTVDPKSEIGKRVGRITHPETGFYGEAFIVDECHIATNFHVAMGKSKDASGAIELDEKAGIGYVANFAFAIDGVSKRFSRFDKATVVRIGNYNPGTYRGKVGDLSVLRLSNCLDKSYAKMNLNRPAAGDKGLNTDLMVVKTVASADGKIEIVAEDGCRTSTVPPFPGLIAHNCKVDHGNSGTMVLAKSADGSLNLAGINVEQNEAKDGTPIGVAVYASVVSSFIDAALGASTEVAPMAELRIPQSEDLSLAQGKGKTIVR